MAQVDHQVHLYFDCYIYIYIYRKREREREREGGGERERLSFYVFLYQNELKHLFP